MKLFVVGDFSGDNGPASVNKLLKQYFPDNSLFSEEASKFKRILELITKIIKSDAVIFSGMSKVNIIGLRLCRILGKKSAYLMHGSVYYEGVLNENKNEKNVIVENKVLKLASKIICVSEEFMGWVKEKYPQYENKTTFVNNGVEWGNHSNCSFVEKDENLILSVGGGIPQKNILPVCKAIEYLNNHEGFDLKLTVIGKKGSDTERIKSYNFVSYIEYVKREEMDLYYSKARIYIQNSLFETFGLAPIEALICGCDLLISEKVGSKSILAKVEERDIIYHNNDVYEISNKIKILLEEPNNQRLYCGIDKEKTSIKESVKKILNILRE